MKNKSAKYPGLHAYLKREKTSQRQLAIKLGVTPPTLWEWLNDRSDMSVQTLCDVADKIGMTTDFILGREQRAERNRKARVARKARQKAAAAETTEPTAAAA